jgi:hypothetical protein
MGRNDRGFDHSAIRSWTKSHPFLGVSTAVVGSDATPHFSHVENSFAIDGTRYREHLQARVMSVDQRYFATLRISLFLFGR